MKALVGYTGFVGSNICSAGKFDALYNSKNIEEAYGTRPDMLIYAGLRAEKYLANNAPAKDMEQILQAEENIVRIGPGRLVLISTIDVFRSPEGVDENTPVDTKGLSAYGYNRYQLEVWVRKQYPEALIVRLPGLFGRNIKKNFIYDYIHRIPSMLRKEKMEELTGIEPELKKYYKLQDNGFYRVNRLSRAEEEKVKALFGKTGFSALHFTDSRSVYQFYDLSRLWDDIQIALNAGIRLFHPATEPVSAAELYEFLSGKEFVNVLGGTPVYYDYRTIHSALFGGQNGYISTKETVLENVKKFVEDERKAPYSEARIGQTI